MSDDFAALEVDASSLPDWNHHECGVSHNGQECWVDCTEITIVSGAHYTDVRVAGLFARRQAVYMAEFR